MKLCLAKAGALAFGTAMVLAAGCSGQPARIQPDTVASDAPRKAMELYDTDKDGFIGGAELDKVPGLKAALKQVDSNGDGKISPDEIAARIQDWKDSKLGRAQITLKVKHNGEPLQGAKVKFVPESFLGGGLRSGEGTTSADGRARVSIPLQGPDDLPGMSPGFYRVEITKDGEPIPAKYNTETTLGQEVAHGAEGMQSGISFDLQY